MDSSIAVHSAELKKELRLVDLVGIQILNSIGYTWIGVAGKLGSSHLIFWLAAVLLFYVPSGITVAHLAREMPLEGGIYQWVKLRFGPMQGFLAAMNIWLMGVLWCAGLGLQFMSLAPYAFGGTASKLASYKPAILLASLLIVCGIMFIVWRGLSIGKWVSTAGAAATVCLYAAVILVAAPHWFAGTSVTPPFERALPVFSLLSLNILGKMGFAALSGIDAVAVFAGEFRSTDVGGAIRKSVWLAAPTIGCMMILGTASVLTFSRPGTIDLIMPPIQALSLGAPGLARGACAVIALMILSGGSLLFGVMSRLPMVAGWDHLLPPWFSRLDPRFKTPVGSVIFAGAVTLVLTVAANIGAGSQEAFQFLANAAVTCYGFAYLAMFAIPLIARGEKPSWIVRVAALSGLVMTLLFVVFSIFPIVEEQNPGWFTIRMVAMVGGLECAGIFYYRHASRA
jgi:amino acid transporter